MKAGTDARRRARRIGNTYWISVAIAGGFVGGFIGGILNLPQFGVGVVVALVYMLLAQILYTPYITRFHGPLLIQVAAQLLREHGYKVEEPVEPDSGELSPHQR